MSGWNPNDGDVLAGHIVALDVAQSKQDGEPYPLVIITPDDGGDEVTVHGHHRVLKEELAKRAPRVGDHLVITYLGRITPDGGRPYAAYRVQGGSNPFTWNLFRDPGDQLPDEHATGQPTDSPTVPEPTAASIGGPPPAPGQIDTRDSATAADVNAIRKLLEAIWHKNSTAADEYRTTITRRAGGPWDVHLTAEAGVKTVAWLSSKAAEHGVDVNKVLA
jgi:hypothetical protein